MAATYCICEKTKAEIGRQSVPLFVAIYKQNLSLVSMIASATEQSGLCLTWSEVFPERYSIRLPYFLFKSCNIFRKPEKLEKVRREARIPRLVSSRF